MEWKSYLIQGAELVFLGLGTYFDGKKKELPILFLRSFLLLSVLGNVLWRYQKPEEMCIGILPGILVLLAAFFTKEKIGYGDGWMILILGLFGGIAHTFFLVLLASFFGGLYGLWCFLGQRKSLDHRIAFCPFLLLARLGMML